MRIQIWRNQVYQSDYDFSKPIEFGRQKVGEPNPIAFVENDDSVRCIVTSHTENTVSRNQLRLEVLGFKVVLTNLNQQRQFELNGLPDLEAGASLSVDMYSEFGFLDLEIRIVQDVTCQSLPNQTLGPGQLSGVQRNAMQSFHSLDDKPLGDTHLSQAKLLHWLTTAMVVFQEAANSPKFLPRAADAVREIVNLSTAAVLLKDRGQWKSHAVSTDGPIDDAWSPSSTILSLIEREKKTFFNLVEQTSGAQSLVGVKAIVASPILSGDNEVIGILYGDRRTGSGSPVEEIEAVLVEVLATGVAAGLARVEQEGKAIRARADFERSFGKEMTLHLEKHPEMLGGRVAEITIMFCDVTGFSRASEQLGPEKTMAWIGQVMGELHQCVIQNEGVVIDYVGDELIAMWGAPAQQADNAKLACQTAIAIGSHLENANREKRFLMPAKVRIGINTGAAHVGDTGTKYRLKYGAMGDTVNLASRLQGATKFFGCDILISAETQRQLDGAFHCRRLGKVKVVNIERPVELFELLPQTTDKQIQSGYEEALRRVESGEFESATGFIEKLASEFPTDAPTQALRKRIHELTPEQMDDNGKKTADVWELPNK